MVVIVMVDNNLPQCHATLPHFSPLERHITLPTFSPLSLSEEASEALSSKPWMVTSFNGMMDSRKGWWATRSLIRDRARWRVVPTLSSQALVGSQTMCMPRGCGYQLAFWSTLPVIGGDSIGWRWLIIIQNGGSKSINPMTGETINPLPLSYSPPTLWWWGRVSKRWWRMR